MNFLLWVTFTSFSNAVVKVRGNAGKASARHRGSERMIIVAISSLLSSPSPDTPGEFVLVCPHRTRGLTDLKLSKANSSGQASAP